MSEDGSSMTRKPVRIVAVFLAVAMMAGEWSVFVERSHAIQAESQTEKEVNLKDQAREGLFNRWTFDQQKPGEAPLGFAMLGFGEGPVADWTIKSDSDAPSASNILAVSSACQAVTCSPTGFSTNIQMCRSGCDFRSTRRREWAESCLG